MNWLELLGVIFLALVTGVTLFAAVTWFYLMVLSKLMGGKL